MSRRRIAPVTIVKRKGLRLRKMRPWLALVIETPSIGRARDADTWPELLNRVARSDFPRYSVVGWRRTFSPELGEWVHVLAWRCHECKALTYCPAWHTGAHGAQRYGGLISFATPAIIEDGAS